MFKKLLAAKRPDIQWVGEQWPPQGKIDAGAVVEAIAKTEPEAILNVCFGPDLVKLVREGNTRGLFKDRAVVSFLTGEPEYLDPLKDETPDGLDRHRLSLGERYDSRARSVPESLSGQIQRLSPARLGRRLFDDQGRGGDPRQGAVDRQRKAGRRSRGRRVSTRRSASDFRAIDHQSTLGAFVGKTALKDGKGVMIDVVYHDGAEYLPPEAEVKAQRPQE